MTTAHHPTATRHAGTSARRIPVLGALLPGTALLRMTALPMVTALILVTGACSPRGSSGDAQPSASDPAPQQETTADEQTEPQEQRGAQAPADQPGSAAHQTDGMTPLERATAARDALGQRLLGRVLEVVNEDGHAAAVEVCHGEAGPITAAVAEELGVRIGRTSDRNRNVANVAPAWAVEVIAARPAEPVLLPQGDDGLHAVFPIRTMPPCLACHGGEADRAPGVDAVLAARYPDDQATGYAAGELRGWFWVEVGR